MEISLVSVYLVLSVLVLVVALITCGFLYLTFAAMSRSMIKEDNVILVDSGDGPNGIFSVYRQLTQGNSNLISQGIEATRQMLRNNVHLTNDTVDFEQSLQCTTTNSNEEDGLLSPETATSGGDSCDYLPTFYCDKNNHQDCDCCNLSTENIPLSTSNFP